jgi:hypothetical protein
VICQNRRAEFYVALRNAYLRIATLTVQLAPLIDEVVGTARELAQQNKNRLVVEAQENLGLLTLTPSDCSRFCSTC